MAFTATTLPYSRYSYFLYYADGLNASMEEDFAPAFAYELHTVRLHLSVVHASVVDFIVRLSSHQNSAHNMPLLSVAMNGEDGYIWLPSMPFIFHSGDTLNFSMTMSDSNRFGLTISGWAITS